MKKIITRAITGAIYVAVIIGCTVGGLLWFSILTALLAMLGVNEFNRITNRNYMSTTIRLLDMLGALILIGCIFCAWSIFTVGRPESNMYEAAVGFLSLGYFCYYIVRFISQLYVNDGNGLEHLSHSITGQIYVVIPLAILTFLYGIYGTPLILTIFVMIWLNDTGAFCVGSLLGRHRLFERISPKKSWEGFFGGLFFCLMGGLGAYYWFAHEFTKIPHVNCWFFLLLGLIVCIASTWGDLIESMIKRSLNVKDSGNMLPGHGGILDRIDSLLLVSPMAGLFMIFATLIWG